MAITAKKAEIIETSIYTKDSQIWVDSHHVGRAFDKRHDSVIRDIKSQLRNVPESWGSHNFVESNYLTPQGKRYRCYKMTEKGFALIAMSYTTKKAMEVKIAFLDQFEKMREMLSLGGVKTESPLTGEAIYLLAQRSIALEDRVEVIEKRLAPEPEVDMLCAADISNKFPNLVKAKDKFVQSNTKYQNYHPNGIMTVFLKSAGLKGVYQRGRTYFAKQEVEELSRGTV